jgi:hypothetical protein
MTLVRPAIQVAHHGKYFHWDRYQLTFSDQCFHPGDGKNEFLGTVAPGTGSTKGAFLAAWSVALGTRYLGSHSAIKRARAGAKTEEAAAACC